MDFRYKLSKEVFKNKKIPAKSRTNEDHISEDQRGDESYVGTKKIRARINKRAGDDDNQVMSLDKETITPQTPPPVIEENQEVSRRGLFRMTSYAAEIAEKEKEEKKLLKKKKKVVKKKKKKKKVASQEEATPSVEPLPAEAVATQGPAETAEPSDPPKPKKGWFKRTGQILAGWFADPVKQEQIALGLIPQEEEEEKATSPAANAEATDESVEAPGTIKVDPREVSREALQSAKDQDSFFGLEDDDEPEKELSRRNLMRQGVHYFAKPTVDSVQKKVDAVNETVSKITKRVPLIRPPGAITERKFLQACTRCDKCIHACPKDAILKAPKSFGMLVVGTPYIDPIKNPCVMCDGLPCIPACPDEALLPVEGGPPAVSMGHAILDKKKCQAYGEYFCQQCVIDCPIPGAITQVDQKPVINRKACTGCGVCVNSCNTVNIPVAIKIKPIMVTESQIRKKMLEEQKAKEAEEKKKRQLEEEQKELELQAAESSSDSNDPPENP